MLVMDLPAGIQKETRERKPATAKDPIPSPAELYKVPSKASLFLSGDQGTACKCAFCLPTMDIQGTYQYPHMAVLTMGLGTGYGM